MNRNLIIVALAASATGVFACGASADTLPFSTGFEASQGYTTGTQLATNAHWTGDGQDASGWAITDGSGAASGSQWLLASSPTGTASRTQWPVTPVTDFSTQAVITGSAAVKLVSPASGTLNRTTSASIAMFDTDTNMIASLSLIIDCQNTFGFGTNRMLAQCVANDGTRQTFDLGASNDLNHYYNLALIADFSAGTFHATVNGTLLSYTGTLDGATDFHDFDLSVEGRTSTSGGQRARAGFDDFSITQTPTPGAAALAGLAGGTLLRRCDRRR